MWRTACSFSSRMLKKSLISPTRSRRAETHLFPCGVFASLLGTVKREPMIGCAAAALPAERRVLARRGWAGEKVAFLNILQGVGSSCSKGSAIEVLLCRENFSVVCGIRRKVVFAR
jgi:hypothetical protein